MCIEMDASVLIQQQCHDAGLKKGTQNRKYFFSLFSVSNFLNDNDLKQDL